MHHQSSPQGSGVPRLPVEELVAQNPRVGVVARSEDRQSGAGTQNLMAPAPPRRAQRSAKASASSGQAHASNPRAAAPPAAGCGPRGSGPQPPASSKLRKVLAMSSGSSSSRLMLGSTIHGRGSGAEWGARINPRREQEWRGLEGRGLEWRWLERGGDLRLLILPMGEKGGQQAGAVAVNPKHGARTTCWPPACSARPAPPARNVTEPGNQPHNRDHRSSPPTVPGNGTPTERVRNATVRMP